MLTHSEANNCKEEIKEDLIAFQKVKQKGKLRITRHPLPLTSRACMKSVNV